MCGIAGVVGPALGQNEVDQVAALLVRLHRRGPDETVQRSHGRSVLGMTRLSIIDLADGHQPFYTADMQAYCVVNGEIYNHVELRRLLEAKGYSFRSRCDIEVIIHLYDEYGTDAFRMLDGMFAIAIFDARQQRLFLARDRFGEKPLAFVRSKDNLYFSSEIMPLVHVGCVSADLDRDSLFEYIFHGFVFEPGTLFKGVSKLQAGCFVDFDVENQSFQTVKYWDISSAIDSIQPAECNIIERLGETMASTTQSDVPVAVALSGGIDSSAIAILGSRFGRIDHAFSVSYENHRLADESGLAEELAKSLGLAFTHIQVRDSDLIDRYPYYVSRLDEPIADPSGFGYLSIMESVHAAGIKVLLTGHGGDELFFGYPWMRNALQEAILRESIVRNELTPAQGVVRSLFQELKGASAFGMLKYLATLRQHASSINQRLSDDRKRSESEYFYRMMPQFEEVTKLFQQEGPTEGLGVRFSYPSVSSSHRLDLQIIESVCMGYLRSVGINQCERLASSQSIELRLPLLHRPFVERVLAFHMQDSALGGSIKRSLAQFIQSELPANSPLRKKRSFAPPIRRWVAKLFAKYGELLNDGRLVHHDVISRRTAQRIAEYSPGISISNFAISLLLLEVWMRENSL